MPSHINPAIEASKDFKRKKSSKNKEYVAINNVKSAIKDIKSKSPILNGMVKKSQIKIMGAHYDLHTGEVIFL